MSKLYHVTVRTERTVGYQPPQFDIIASNSAIAVKRALDAKTLRTAKRVRVECNLSDHGEYDKASFAFENAVGGVIWGPQDAQGTYIKRPSHVRRAQARERLGIEAQRIIDATPADRGDHTLVKVTAKSRGVKVEVYRAGYEPEHVHSYPVGQDVCEYCGRSRV